MIEQNSHNEEQELAERLRRALRPASPSPEFRDRLRQRLGQEAREQASRNRRPVWQTPWIWAPAAAALGLILAFLIVPLFSAATGTMVIRITDAPPEERRITEINIIVKKIDVHLAGDADSENGTWITVVEGSYPFDLLSLDGVVDTIGSREVPAGKYTQMRIEVEAVNAIVEDGQEEELKIPSDNLKIVNFAVAEGGTTVVTLDFDTQEEGSLTDTGDKIILNPTIKLEVTQED